MMRRKANVCGICENPNPPSICLVCVNYSVFNFVASAKGKNDSSGKTKKGWKVQFGFDDSVGGSFMKSNGKADKLVGKGYKVGKGGKGQTAKAPTPLELRVEQEIFGNTKCLLDCEAAKILQGTKEKMVVLSEDPTIKLPVSFDKGLMYAQRHKLYENSRTVK